jgi:hypothetical protein
MQFAVPTRVAARLLLSAPGVKVHDPERKVRRRSASCRELSAPALDHLRQQAGVTLLERCVARVLAVILAYVTAQHTTAEQSTARRSTASQCDRR